MAGLTAAELEAVVGVDDSPFSKGLDSVLGKLEGFGGKAGAILAGVGALGGGLFAAGVSSGMASQDVAAQLQAELGLTVGKSKQLGDLAGRVYAQNYGGSLEEVGSAVATVVSSIQGMRKASNAEVEDMTKKALTFAQVFEVDVARAAQVAGGAVKVGLAKDAGQAFDMLTATMQKVPKQLREDILDATDEYGQFFSSLGIKGPQAFGMLAQGAAKGMYGIDKTGDAIKEFTIRATDGSDATQTALQAIGLNADKMANDLLKGGSKGAAAFDKIVGGLNDIQNPLKQSKAALALFGTPLEDLGTKDMGKFLAGLERGSQGLGKFKGATDDMGKAIGNTASANIETAWRKIKAATVGTIGGAVIPAVTDLTAAANKHLGPAMSAVGDAAKGSVKWLTEHKAVSASLVGVIAALAAVTAAHAAVMSVSAAGGMAAWLKGTKLISAATRVWAAVQWALNLAMNANPIGLVVLAIAALVGGLILAYKKSDTFRAIVDAAFRAVGDAGMWLWDHALKPAFSGIKAAIGAVGDAGRWLWNNALQPAFSSIVRGVGVLLGIWAKMLHGLAKVPGFGWADSAANALDRAAGKANNLADSIRKIPEQKTIHVDYFSEVHGKRPSGKGFGAVDASLATGGRVTGPTVALIGEGREPESVLPDSVLRGLLERAHDAGARKGDGRGGLLRDVNIHGREGASARELIGELTHALRVADHGGVYA